MNVSIFVIVIGSFFILRSEFHSASPGEGGGGALGHFLGGYVPPGTPNWHPVNTNSPKIDTPF